MKRVRFPKIILPFYTTFEVIPIFSKKLLQYYDAHKRVLPWRNSPTPYRVWVSEIMLQQTRASAVIPYYENFLQTLPTVEALAHANETTLNKLWEGLGYYSRVRNMKKAAQEILSQYHGQLPSTYQELLKLKGIGPYTAGAIASIAFNQPVPAIDGNVLRIYSRLHCIQEPIDSTPVKKWVFQQVSQDISCKRPGDFNQALMDLGNEHCLPKNPRCLACPVAEYCQAYKEKRQGEFPVKKAKAEKKIENWTILILEKNGTFFIHKRPSKGLLANLWQFIQLPSHLKKKEVHAYLEGNGYSIKNIKKLDPSQHIFTHKIWNMQGYWITLGTNSMIDKSQTYEKAYTYSHWASPREIEDVYPFASAIGKYTKEVLSWNG